MTEVDWIITEGGNRLRLDALQAECEKQGIKVHRLTIQEALEMKEPICERAFVYGTVTTVEQLTREFGYVSWLNKSMPSCTQYYPIIGSRLVNHRYVMFPAKDAPRHFDMLGELWGSTELFVRPNSGAKRFDGKVVDFHNCRKLLRTSAADDIVIVAPPKKIENEWRIFLHYRHPIAWSQYKPEVLRETPAEVFDFAEQVIEASDGIPYADLGYLGRPNKLIDIMPNTWIMDIARTEDGLGVLEISGVCCAGTYEADLAKIVESIHEDVICEYKYGKARKAKAHT